MYLTFPSVKLGYAKLQYLGGNVVVVVFGDVDIGVTFGCGGLVGRYGFLVSRVVRGGGVGAVHAGVITGWNVLSVVVVVFLPLVGPGGGFLVGRRVVRRVGSV